MVSLLNIQTLHFAKGTKNVAKCMAKIAVGSQKNAGRTWFPQLADKRWYNILTL